MAVFPDRIILKNTTDPANTMGPQLNPTGSAPITDGELVIRQDNGFWELYSITADDQIVSLLDGALGAASINDLGDVNITEPIAPLSLLTWDGSEWVAQAPPGYDISGNTLNDLGDVTLTPGAAGEYLGYDQDSGQYINKPVRLYGAVDVVPPTLSGELANGSTLVFEYNIVNDVPGYVTRPLRASELEDDLGLVTGDVATTLGELTNVNPDVDSSASDGSVLSWDSANQEWAAAPAGVPDLTLGSIGDLGDVNLILNAPQVDGQALIWRDAQAEFVAGAIQYGDIDDAPAFLSDLGNDLTLSDFPNDADFLTGLGDSNLDDLGDVNFTGLAGGDVLSYDGTSWVNSAAPPADISGSSIRDLNDVSVTDGLLKVSNTSGYDFTTSVAANADQSLFIEGDQDDLNIVTTRDSDDQGVRISLSRAEGIRLRSDVEFFRLLGNKNSISNTPALVWHAGTTTTGRSVAIQLPDSGITQDYTYLLPQSPGTNGQVLALDSSTGQTYWQDSSSITELGQIGNVDLLTYPPGNGDVLTYQLASGKWVSLPQQADLSISTLDEISDVSYPTTPTQGQALTWNNEDQEWQPNTVVLDAAETLGELDDVDLLTNPPIIGQTLLYTGSGEWVPGVVPGTVGNLQLVGDVSYPQPRTDRDFLVYNSTTLEWENSKPSTNDLADVDLSTPQTEGQILTWDDTAGNWVPVDQISSIGELDDVDIITNAPANGKFLGWDSNLNAFTPIDVETGNISLDNLTDVDVTSNPPSNNDLLRYNQVSGNWVPYTPLSVQVVISSDTEPTTRGDGSSLQNGDQWWKTDTNQLYVYEGGSWETPSAGSIDNLSDVDTSTVAPVDGQALVWNNSSGQWEPGSVSSGGGSVEAGGTYLTETQTGVSGDVTFTGIGYSGVLQGVTSTADAWVTIYTTAAARTADAGRLSTEDPLPGSGVVAEFILTANTTSYATPGTMYLNNDATPAEAIYVAHRNVDGTPLAGDLTITAYGIATITSVSGGTFGSGV